MRKLYKKYLGLIIWIIFASIFAASMCCAVSRVFSTMILNTNHQDRSQQTNKTHFSE